MQGPENNTHQKQRSFYPEYLFEVVVAIAITLEVLFVLSALYPKSIGRVIDFTAPYQPKPEWYFLWLYQLVRYFHGPMVFVGTVVLPLVGLVLLLVLPWIDRRLGARVARAVGLGLFLAFGVLTALAALG